MQVVKYLKGKNSLSGDPEGDFDVESDCEEDSPEEKEESQEHTRAVFVTGSFSACVLFEYPILSCQEITCSSAGSLYSSTTAPVKFRLLPLDRRALNLV